MIGFEITKEQLKAYKGGSLREYRLHKCQRAFEKIYGRLKRLITIYSPLLAIGLTGLTTQFYV